MKSLYIKDLRRSRHFLCLSVICARAWPLHNSTQVSDIAELLNFLIFLNQNQSGNHHIKIPVFTRSTNYLPADRICSGKFRPRASFNKEFLTNYVPEIPNGCEYGSKFFAAIAKTLPSVWMLTDGPTRRLKGCQLWLYLNLLLVYVVSVELEIDFEEGRQRTKETQDMVLRVCREIVLKTRHL